METWVIVMLVIFGIAILVGIGVGVYFLTRPKKKTGSTPLNLVPGKKKGGLLPTSPPGAGGYSFPKNQNFSLTTATNSLFKASASNQTGYTDSVFAYNTFYYNNAPCASYVWQYKDVTRNFGVVPNAIEFEYPSPNVGVLYPTTDKVAVPVGGIVQNARKLAIDNNNISSAQAKEASWIFVKSQFGRLGSDTPYTRICLQHQPNMCIFVVDTDVSGSYATMVLADTSGGGAPDNGFNWVTGPIPTKQCT